MKTFPATSVNFFLDVKLKGFTVTDCFLSGKYFVKSEMFTLYILLELIHVVTFVFYFTGGVP